MIDEGHDFEADWLQLVVSMVDSDSDSVLLLYVGTTRATERLLVTAQEPGEFAQRLAA